MFEQTRPFCSFAVDNLDAAREFYADVLGLTLSAVSEQHPLLGLDVGSDRDILIYEKRDHAPATFTILNFPVDDIDQAVDELAERGVSFERYDSFDQDEKGISRAGPSIAWFTDPAGNVLSVLSGDMTR